MPSDGGRVSVARWERLARAAGISRDDHWQPRLARLRRVTASAPTRRVTDRADEAERLAAFIDDLRRDLGHPQPHPHLAGLGRVVRTPGAVPPRSARSSTSSTRPNDWRPTTPAECSTACGHLDAVSRPVTRGEFRAAFAAEFEVAPGRLGRLGDGVTVGSLAGTVGLDADLTIVLGAADGLLPPAPPTDPLISDTTGGPPGSPPPTSGHTASIAASSATRPPPRPWS